MSEYRLNKIEYPKYKLLGDNITDNKRTIKASLFSCLCGIQYMPFIKYFALFTFILSIIIIIIDLIYRSFIKKY